MATLLPPGELQFSDGNGVPLAGGSLYFYVPNTSDFKTTWQDSGQQVLNTNPIILDSAGRAVIYGSGIYRQVLVDSAGNTIWDQLTASTDVGGTAWGGTSSGSADAQTISSGGFSQQDGQQIAFIVGPGLTNTGPTTVAPGGGAGIPILYDAVTGPQPCAGGEMVAGNSIVLLYDVTRGAFHLVNPASGIISGTTITNSTINTTTIDLKQGTDPAPTDEGDIEWSTLFNHIKIGDGASTQRFLPGPAPGALYGCTIANNGSDATNDIDFGAGIAADSTNELYIVASALTKQLDATWAAGTNQGGLFSGSVANGTYHCFLILNPTTGVVDAGFDTSAVAANRPAGYTYFRRVGSIMRKSSANLAFVQYGDYFYWKAPPTDVSQGNPGTSAVTATLTTPAGVVDQAIINVWLSDATTSFSTAAYVSALSVTDVAPTSPAVFTVITPLNSGGGATGANTIATVPTNLLSQVRYRLSSSNADIGIVIYTLGWIDNRDRFG